MLFTKKDLHRLIIPLIVEQTLAVAVGTIDTMMVANVGEAAVSGVSLVDMINVLLLNVFAAVATGGAVVCSQQIGLKKEDSARDAANQLLTVTFFISLAIMAVVLYFRSGMIHVLFGTVSEEVFASSLTYLTIMAMSYPFLAIYNSCAALFRSMNNSKISMKVSLLMNVVNIIGNAILIYGLGMGVAGAAIASLLSRILASMVMLFLLHNRKNVLYFSWRKAVHLQPVLIKKILNIGIPNGIENSMFQLGRVLVVSMISIFGTVQIAANAVANNFDSIGCIPGQAIGLAMITVVGQCVGAGDFEQAEHYAKELTKMAYLIMGVLNILILSTMFWTLQFYHLSPETTKLSMILIGIHDGSCIILWPLAFVLPNALRAANDVKRVMTISLVSMWTFRICGGYYLAVILGYGAIGIWIAMIIDWIFRAAMFTHRFKSGRWKFHQI